MLPDPRSAGPPSSAPTALGAQGPPPKCPEGRNPPLKARKEPRGGLPFLAMRMQFSRVSWRQRWGLSAPPQP